MYSNRLFSQRFSFSRFGSSQVCGTQAKARRPQLRQHRQNGLRRRRGVCPRHPVPPRRQTNSSLDRQWRPATLTAYRAELPGQRYRERGRAALLPQGVGAAGACQGVSEAVKPSGGTSPLGKIVARAATASPWADPIAHRRFRESIAPRPRAAGISLSPLRKGFHEVLALLAGTYRQRAVRKAGEEVI